MIPQATIDRILGLTRVEEVIGDYVQLKKSGARYLGCCPFHSEKTPSFSVTPSKGLYYCFGCHKGGNVLTFLMENQAMSYTEAIRYLGNKYNVLIEEEEDNADVIASRQERESLMLASDFASSFYAESLFNEGEGRAVGYAYLRGRGIEDETIRKFALGWSPSDRYALVKAAAAKGYKEEYLLKVGVCSKGGSDGSRVYDRFHDRVIFPIHSISGRVIAFGGRTLFSDYKERNIGKYINSPESEIYVKSNQLYGLYQAKSAIMKEDMCLLVEGNIDVISMHQLGLTNTVASCGTALTSDQLRLIRRFTDKLTIIYDGDSAGIHAADRGIDLALKAGFKVRVVLLPDGQDPDDYCRKHSLEEVRNFIASNSTDFIKFKAGLGLDAAGDDPLKRSALINDIANTIALIDNPVERAEYCRSCAALVGTDLESLKDTVKIFRRHAEEEKSRSQQRPATTGSEIAQSPGGQVKMPGAEGVRRQPVTSPLEPIERNLMEFLLRDGDMTMNFDRDSRFFSEEPFTVAEFIDSSLAEDGLILTIEAYRKTYDAYFKLYDEGLSQNDIILRLAAHTDSQIPSTVASLTIDRHEVTGEKLLSTLTSEQTIILKAVPKALLMYHEKLLTLKEEDCRKSIRENPSEAIKYLGQIKEISEQRRLLNQEIAKL